MKIRLNPGLIIIVTLIVVIATVLVARPFKSPVIDGTITGDGTDWDYDDLAVDDPLGDTTWGPNEIDDLWVTYDSLALYIGVRYRVSENAMIVLIDAGLDVGASDINNLDWYPRNFNFPDTTLANLIIANWDASPLGVRRILDNETTEDITSLCQTANAPKGDFFFEGEVRIPWDAIYQLGEGKVIPGVKVKLVALLAGGDNWNGIDSAPDNPGMDGEGNPTTIVNMYTLKIDADADSIPDGFYGAIEGSITFEDPNDTTTVCTVKLIKESNEKIIDEQHTSPGGGSYSFDRLPDGYYTVLTSAHKYAPLRKTHIHIENQSKVTGVDFYLPRAGKITGTVTFAEGPGAETYVSAYDAVTGEIAGEGAVYVPETGGEFTLFVPDGDYIVVTEAEGYVPDSTLATITGSDSVYVGTISLKAVRAREFVLIDQTGKEIESVGTTVSFPDSNIYFYAIATVEARDEAGRRDYFDIDGKLGSVALKLTKLNNTTPPRGNAGIFSTDTIPITEVSFTEGRATILIRDDEIEVLRVHLTSMVDSTITGKFKTGIRPAEPEYLEMTASKDTIIANDEDIVTINVKLLDVSKNPVQIAEIPVSFSVDQSSTGDGLFKIPSVETSADGKASTEFVARKSGPIYITVSASYLNKPLIPITPDGKSLLEIFAIAGEPASIVLNTESEIVGAGETMNINAQLIDKFGNSVERSGYNLTFSVTPPDAGTISPPSADLNESGSATVQFTAGEKRSVVEIDATSNPPLTVSPTTFLIFKPVEEITLSDPQAPEPDQAHNSFAEMDLTDIYISDDPNGINVKIRFSSPWEGVHIALIMETNSDPAGGTYDPFEFPISYSHSLKPDFALTYKYSSDDYADLRKWIGTEWAWWDNDGKTYIPVSGEWVEGINIKDDWISRDDSFVYFKIPFTVFGNSIPDTIRFEAYIMQEYAGEKRSAFDSAPHDSTLDLDFDPLDPNADWSVTIRPVTLHAYSEPYVLDLPPAPEITKAEASPSSLAPGSAVRLTAEVEDVGGGVGDITIDLSSIGGAKFQPMKDDGTNGDEIAGDGVYSYLYTISPELAGGEYSLTISAKDSTNASIVDTTITITVEGKIEPIREFTDETGDDHGPNLFGREGLYYLYPTNSVFVNGAFDIEKVTIYETSKLVGSEVVPSIAFQVKIGDFPNPKDEGTADWNPLYADINIQKVDIYIDAFKGGATEGLPNRQNDFAKWDAWDYAIVMEGWYKAVISSNNQNTPQAWAENAKKSDRDIILTSDYENNTITAIVSKEALDNPTPQEIMKWDIIVVMTSHDGHSDDNNFGDTRWVNASVSEWQFGGGQNTDRDPNIIDLTVSPGLGRNPGRPQSEMLNYKSRTAVERARKGLTPCVLEATAFEDQGPPIISIENIENETIPIRPLFNAPLYFSANITDDDEVKEANIYWRADSVLTDTWMGTLRMGYVGKDIWNADFPLDEILSTVPLSPGDSTRNVEFVIEARDPSDKVTTSPPYTIEIFQPSTFFESKSIETDSIISIDGPEGSNITLTSAILPELPEGYHFDYRLYSGDPGDFPLPPHPATGINVIRTFEILATDGASTTELEEFDEPIEITIHYPNYYAKGIDEDLLAIYEFNPRTRTWVLMGGNVNPYGNMIKLLVNRTGTYGIFYDPNFRYSPGEVFSGVTFSPNPFSPNGDGIYDETYISFYLTKEATVTVEIYNIDGYRVKILEKRFAFTAEDTPDNRPRRITGLVWDGRDNMGKIVPYGIYIARFTVTFQQAGGQRTIRTNAAVAVIK